MSWLLRGVLPAVIVWGAVLPAVYSDTRPNVVLILSDDQGIGDVGCYGGEIPTPHVDSLAAEGVTFNAWYVAAPQCTPSRFSLLTGRYPNRSRDGLMSALMFLQPGDASRGIRPEETTIAEVLQKQGYRTALFGKWHLGHGRRAFFPTRHGFDDFYGCAGGCVDYFTLSYGKLPDWYRQEEPSEDRGYATDLISDAAVGWLVEQEPGKPFFVYLSYTAPHYGNVWNPDKQHHDSILQPKPEMLNRVAHIADPKRRDYAAMVLSMDDGIGRVLQVLKRRKLEESTLVIFTSDNGADPNFGGSNGRLRGKKATLFEGGVRVPCVMRWPGRIKPGTTSRQLSSALDVFPTLCRLADADPGQFPCDGIDLTPALLEDQTLPRELYWKKGRAGALRRGPWKYVTGGGGREMLFHLPDDPGEKVNVARRQSGLLAELRTRHGIISRELSKE